MENVGSTITIEGLRDALLQLGWQDDDESDVMARHYTLTFENVRVTGTAQVCLSDTVGAARRGNGNFDPHIAWTPDANSPPHPHSTPGGLPPYDMCYSSTEPIVPGEMANLQLALLINHAPTEYDEDSIADVRWRPCNICGHKGFNRYCDSCDMAVCDDCWAEHDESEHGNNEEEAAEDDQTRATSPTLGMLGRVLLVGCGVTGSWIHAVLSRTARVVLSVDPDSVSIDNAHGHWGCHYGMSKAMAVAEERYGDRCFSRVCSLEILEILEVETVDLIVLCPDNANARLYAANVGCPLLDIRSTTSGLTVWAIPSPRADNNSLREAWCRSLEGYPIRQACADHHDNVQITAGVLAASFTAWWITNEMPSGVWSIPYGYTGMTFEQPGALIDEVNPHA